MDESVITTYASYFKVCESKKDVRDKTKQIPWIKLLSGHAKDFVESCCCSKHPYPELSCDTGTKITIPTLIVWQCIHGTYQDCGVNKKHNIDGCNILINNGRIIDLFEWNDISRQLLKKYGTPNTQLELSRTKLTVGQLLVQKIFVFIFPFPCSLRSLSW